ncbi:hypothetical protein RHSIM_Rhsim08G0053900 [Rhododendron simsii]|uniref:Uncharacterized protein n=1 Tax=Rhododendron simsii TaxID=118357 RepID=A0A834GM97_RHOSS|nr:hypothetical protein RHSIM_Rhsim08G0053900 [Rhododendron simsii]
MEEAGVSYSPSFNFYSSNGLAEKPTEVPDGMNPSETWTDVDDDFEFAWLSSDYDVTADEIFREGQIRQIFPIFNRDLLTRNDIRDQTDGVKPTELTLRLRLEKSVVDDELDSVPAGTYCEDSFVFLTPKHREQKAEIQGTVEAQKKAGKVSAKMVSAHEAFYVRNRAWKQGEKRKSYLPYRRDLVGFGLFANVNVYGKAFPPF